MHVQAKTSKEKILYLTVNILDIAAAQYLCVLFEALPILRHGGDTSIVVY